VTGASVAGGAVVGASVLGGTVVVGASLGVGGAVVADTAEVNVGDKVVVDGSVTAVVVVCADASSSTASVSKVDNNSAPTNLRPVPPRTTMRSPPTSLARMLVRPAWGCAS
jgi:hypothetical protein